MIARMWTGVIRTEDRDAYADYLERTGLGEYRETPGNVDAYALYRDLGDARTEVTTVSLWQSIDHIRAFAGEQIERAVYYPEDDRFLLERPDSVVHSEVARSGEPKSESEIPRVDDIVLACADAGSEAAFWGALLDRPVRRVHDHRFTLDGSSPRLSFIDTLAGDDGSAGSEEASRNSGKPLVVFELAVEDVEAAGRRATSLGATNVGSAPDADPGSTGVYQDPAGHAFRLVPVAIGDAAHR